MTTSCSFMRGGTIQPTKLILPTDYKQRQRYFYKFKMFHQLRSAFNNKGKYGTRRTLPTRPGRDNQQKDKKKKTAMTEDSDNDDNFLDCCSSYHPRNDLNHCSVSPEDGSIKGSKTKCEGACGLSIHPECGFRAADGKTTCYHCLPIADRPTVQLQSINETPEVVAASSPWRYSSVSYLFLVRFSKHLF